MDDALLVLPSAGPDPLTWETALAAVLGYARGRRALRFRSPSNPDGAWVAIPAFGYERFDKQPVPDSPLGEHDILVAEGLHGRLDPAAWMSMKRVLDDVRPLADAAVDRAAGRPLWELPDDEFCVLAEPGTVGAVFREIRSLSDEFPDANPKHVAAALHHRRPALFPLLNRTTRWQLLPHAHEGDSGVEAVIHRELSANVGAFADLETALDRLGHRLTRLRVHDILVWLAGSLRLTHAVELGRATDEWRVHGDAAVQRGYRPV